MIFVICQLLPSLYKISDESVDMAWFSLDELRNLVAEGKAQERAFAMALNATQLFAA